MNQMQSLVVRYHCHSNQITSANQMQLVIHIPMCLESKIQHRCTVHFPYQILQFFFNLYKTLIHLFSGFTNINIMAIYGHWLYKSKHMWTCGDIIASLHGVGESYVQHTGVIYGGLVKHYSISYIGRCWRYHGFNPLKPGDIYAFVSLVRIGSDNGLLPSRQQAII